MFSNHLTFQVEERSRKMEDNISSCNGFIIITSFRDFWYLTMPDSDAALKWNLHFLTEIELLALSNKNIPTRTIGTLLTYMKKYFKSKQE